jgi:hypothetical protein
VDTFPLQNVGVHVVKVWSAFSLTQKEGRSSQIKGANICKQKGKMFLLNFPRVFYSDLWIQIV